MRRSYENNRSVVSNAQVMVNQDDDITPEMLPESTFSVERQGEDRSYSNKYDVLPDKMIVWLSNTDINKLKTVPRKQSDGDLAKYSDG